MKYKRTRLFCYGILSFILPVGLLGLYLAINSISLDQLLLSDANEQYVYLFRYLKGILTGQESIFYAFSKGIGGPMWEHFVIIWLVPFIILSCLSVIT